MTGGQQGLSRQKALNPLRILELTTLRRLSRPAPIGGETCSIVHTFPGILQPPTFSGNLPIPRTEDQPEAARAADRAEPEG